MAQASNADQVSRVEFDELLGRLRVIEDNAVEQSARLAKAEERIALLEAVIEDTPPQP